MDGDQPPSTAKKANGLPAIALGLLGFFTFAMGPGFFILIASVLVSPPVHRWLGERAARKGKVHGTKQAVILSLAVIVGPWVAFVVLALACMPFISKPAQTPAAPAAQHPAPAASPAPVSIPKPPLRPVVEIVPAGDTMRPAQDALNRGDVQQAIRLFFASSVTPEQRASPAGRRLRDAIQAASDARGGNDRSAEFVEQIAPAQMAKLKALSTSAPTSMQEAQARVAAYEEFARVLEEHPALGMKPDALKARTELKAAIGARQMADFPVLRKAYGHFLRETLWEMDVEITVQGKANRTIRFIGGMFAANRNVGETHRGMVDRLQKFRFSRDQYEWYRGSEFQYWTLTVPADGAVGHWDAGTFAPVE